MTKKEQAVETFRSGFNCAQAVFSTFSEELNIDAGLARRIASGFGAGMARLQETCGAVTGAYMVIGLYICNSSKDKNQIRDTLYPTIQNFFKDFEKVHHTTNCMELINCDLRTEEGQKKFHNEMINVNVCEKCIETAAGLLEDIMRNS